MLTAMECICRVPHKMNYNAGSELISEPALLIQGIVVYQEAVFAAIAFLRSTVMEGMPSLI